MDSFGKGKQKDVLERAWLQRRMRRKKNSNKKKTVKVQQYLQAWDNMAFHRGNGGKQVDKERVRELRPGVCEK